MDLASQWQPNVLLVAQQATHWSPVHHLGKIRPIQGKQEGSGSRGGSQHHGGLCFLLTTKNHGTGICYSSR